MKKLISLALVAAMLAAMLPATLFSAFAADDDATVINTVEELKAATDGNYRLGADLDLGGAVLTEPLATLTGTLDGDGHSVTNFSLAYPESAADEGGEGEEAETIPPTKLSLFAQGEGELTIKNLTIGAEEAPVSLSGAPLGSESGRAAVLVAEVLRNITFEKVAVYANVHDVTLSYLGGMVGLCDAGTATFRQCAVYGSLASCINRENLGMGAFLGTLGGSGSAWFEQCANYAAVTDLAPADGSAQNENSKVGGYIGFVNTSSGSVTVRNCANYGEIVGWNYVAGLFGHLNSGKAAVNGYWNSADITANNMFAGAVFGRMHGSELTAENVLNTGIVPEATAHTGAFGGHHSGGTLNITNYVTYGSAPFVISNGSGPSSLASVFYYGTYGNMWEGVAADDRIVKLGDSNAVLETINAEGFMDDFRAIWGDFENTDLEMADEPLSPDRTVPTELPPLVEDSPFTQYVPGFVLHNMVFSNVSSFASTGYFISKDSNPTRFRLQDGALQIDTSDGAPVYLLFTGNGIPQNAGNITLNFEASFASLRAEGYLAVLASASLGEDLKVNKQVDICFRNGVGADTFPMPDGCGYGPGEYTNGGLTNEAATKANWAKIGEQMAAGEKIRFSFSFKDSKLDNILVSSGDVTVSLSAPADKDTRDMGSWFGLMLKNMQMNLYSVQVVAGAVDEYTELTWPADEGGQVLAVDPAAEIPAEDDDDDGNNTGDDDTDVTTGGDNTSTEPQGTDPAGDTADEKGCASAIGGSLALLAVLALAGGMTLKKKQD